MELNDPYWYLGFELVIYTSMMYAMMLFYIRLAPFVVLGYRHYYNTKTNFILDIIIIYFTCALLFAIPIGLSFEYGRLIIDNISVVFLLFSDVQIKPISSDIPLIIILALIALFTFFARYLEVKSNKIKDLPL